MKKEKGKKKKERGKSAGTSIYPDESGPLGNRILPARPQTAPHQKPPFEGGQRGVKTATNYRKIPIFGLSQIPQMFAEKICANPRDLRAK